MVDEYPLLILGREEIDFIRIIFLGNKGRKETKINPCGYGRNI